MWSLQSPVSSQVVYRLAPQSETDKLFFWYVSLCVFHLPLFMPNYKLLGDMAFSYSYDHVSMDSN